MTDLKSLIIAVEAGILLVFSVAEVVSGQLLGAAILLVIASLAAACAWVLWPTRRGIIRLADEAPRKAGSSRRPRR